MYIRQVIQIVNILVLSVILLSLQSVVDRSELENTAICLLEPGL